MKKDRALQKGKREKKSLMRELATTVLLLIAALLGMWLFFYVNLNGIIRRFVMTNMSQAAEQIATQMEHSLLQIEETSYALAQNEEVKEFLKERTPSDFVAKAGQVEGVIEYLSGDSLFMENVIIYNADGMFYRFAGHINNTGARRLLNVITKEQVRDHFKIYLDDTNYIGFTTQILEVKTQIGTVVLLAREDEITRLFEEASQDDNIRIVLTSGEEILAANCESEKAKEAIAEKNSAYTLVSPIGFTPFSLVVSYADSNNRIRNTFFIAMLAMALILMAILVAFILFWRREFFLPIQRIITSVEAYGQDSNSTIEETGLEQFDGLVQQINAMALRIETKEKVAYEALIASLKRQISAHFTVNVLNIIKALSSNGENEKAGRLCEGLSNLLQYANGGEHFIGGMEEFFVLEKYASIMEIRYPNRFVIDIDMEDELENVQIPRMLLQPILENAIVHGILGNNTDKMGQIRVYAKVDECVTFFITDNGCGMERETLEKLQKDLREIDEEDVQVEGLSHVALVNVQRRIISYFGRKFGIEVESHLQEGTTVKVVLPRNTGKGELVRE